MKKTRVKDVPSPPLHACAARRVYPIAVLWGISYMVRGISYSSSVGHILLQWCGAYPIAVVSGISYSSGVGHILQQWCGAYPMAVVWGISYSSGVGHML